MKNKFDSVIDYYKKFNRDSKSRINIIHSNFNFLRDIFGAIKLPFLFFGMRLYSIFFKKKISIALLGASILEIPQSPCGSSDSEFCYFVYMDRKSRKKNFQQFNYGEIYLFCCFLSFFSIFLLTKDFFIFRMWSRPLKDNMRYIFFVFKNTGYRVLFLLSGVKKIYLIDSYSTNMSALYAAKKCNANIIEIQHGIISRGHLGYNRVDLDRNFYPNVLLLWDYRFVSETPIVSSGLVDYSIVCKNPLSLLNVYEGQPGGTLVIGQPSISKKLVRLTQKISCFTDVLYKPHPREMLSYKVKETVFLGKEYNSNQLVIGGFSTLLLELKCSGVKNVVAVREFVPVEYISILIAFDVQIVDLENVVKCSQALG